MQDVAQHQHRAGSDSDDSQSRNDGQYPPPKGAINSDGSVSLGFRPRQGQEPSRNLPELTRSQNGHAHPQNELGNYQQGQMQQHDGNSLSVDNRLPPMASYHSPNHRPSSLSPNFLLSPNIRKRSFSSTMDEQTAVQQSLQAQHLAQNQQQQQQLQGDGQRLSGIRSILNPPQASTGEEALDPSLRTPQEQSRSPSQNYAHVAMMGQNGNGVARVSPPRGEQEMVKEQKREMLRREAERMREELRRKEKELEELNQQD